MSAPAVEVASGRKSRPITIELPVDVPEEEPEVPDETPADEEIPTSITWTPWPRTGRREEQLLN